MPAFERMYKFPQIMYIITFIRLIE